MGSWTRMFHIKTYCFTFKLLKDLLHAHLFDFSVVICQELLLADSLKKEKLGERIIHL